MNIQKIKIISNNICYGPPPSPTDEVKQHLTISLTGRVWFTGYDYGEGYGKHKIGRSCQVSIGKTKAAYMLSLFSKFFSSEIYGMFVTDIGSWEIIITDTDSNKLFLYF